MKKRRTSLEVLNTSSRSRSRLPANTELVAEILEMAPANLDTKRAHIVVGKGAGVSEAAAAEAKGKATEAAGAEPAVESATEAVPANKKHRLIRKEIMTMDSNLKTLP